METDEQTLTDEELRAELSGKAINDLPDDAFAFIEPGGEKDAEGKTTPRALRHFPVHDEAHARNALAQAPKSPFGGKAMPKILAACKKFGVEVAEQKDADIDVEERAECPTCEGAGKIMDGNRDCPDCEGSGEVRSAPTPEDAGIAHGLSGVKQALAGVKAKQLADPDNATDPDDEDVMAGIEAAEKAIDKAIVAQGKDSDDQRSARPRRKERRRAVPLMPEVRHWRATGLEVRSAKDTDEITISGEPIVYEADYSVMDMFGEFTERMAPGVASDVLADGADVRFLFNHDGLPLARSTSGTLSLTDGPKGLTFQARLDARQQLANDLAIAIERGDVSQMSCGFIVARDEWDEAMEDRTVLKFADLLDVSAVTYPASPSTSIQIAQRMAMEIPVESRARLREYLVAERAGKVLSGPSKEKVAAAIEALLGLHEAGGGNVADFMPESAEQAQTDGANADPAAGQAFLDGTGERSETLVDPGEKIRTKTSRALHMEIELARKRQRVAA